MCGLVGSLDFGAVHTDRSTLEAMTRTLSHRGPDGSGVAIAGPAGLGHRRLRIIDLSEAADQPMWNAHGDIAIVFNGEIYNFRELRAELEKNGRRFRTQSDTEVVLALYEQEGSRALQRLDGMFALAIWDGKHQNLLLARDRAGQKPLFYFHDDRHFLFASEIKAIQRHPAVPREPDFDLLPTYLTYGYIPAPRTAYRNIRTLPPGTWTRIASDGTQHTERYWSAPYEVNGIRDLSEATDRLRVLMRRAVEKRLIADVPLGAFLSGGLDSTVVVALMSEATTRPVKTFSIGFEGAPEFDETAYAEEAASVFGCEHTTFRVSPPDGEFFDRLIHHHDGPFGDSSAIPTFIVSQLAREQATVVLNGDGGDELFAGYQRLAAAALSESVPRSLRRVGALARYLVPEPASHAHPFRRARQFLEISARPLSERIQAWSSFFRRAELERLLGRRDHLDVGAHFEHFLNEASGATTLGKLLYLNFCTYLPEDLLVKMDRMSMAHGLEARSPFLDTELTEFAGRLPDSMKLRHFTTKFVLREAFKDRVPARINERRKMGFGVPLGAWFRNRLSDYLDSHLRAVKAPIFEHLERDAVVQLLDEHQQGRRDRGQQLFSLLTLALWLKQFGR